MLFYRFNSIMSKKGAGLSTTTAEECGGWAFFEQGLEEYKENMLRADWWYNITVSNQETLIISSLWIYLKYIYRKRNIFIQDINQYDGPMRPKCDDFNFI